MERVDRRLARAAGSNWALLPHTYAFFDPLFSTGIAWGLLGVERLAEILNDAWKGGDLSRDNLARGLTRYEVQLEAEADQMEQLLIGAWAAMGDFELFVQQSFLYFAAVSYAEAAQRLDPEPREGLPPAWQGFLGSGDPRLRTAFAEARQRVKRLMESEEGAVSGEERRRFANWIAQTIAPWNVAGLADPRQRNLYGVDLDILVERSELLGMTPDQIREAIPLLRGLQPSASASTGSSR